ncbi:MAG: SixA phosphatase family protein [Janthinobacterium lividum]
MDLIIWRHAEAEDGIPDMARALTRKGEKQAAMMAAWLKTMMPEQTRILASPARRTQQTAQALGLPFETCPALAPGKTVAALLDAAGWPDADGTVLVIGHNPTLGEVGPTVLGAGQGDAGDGWPMKKAAVMWFVSDDAECGHASLEAAMTPRLLRSTRG